MKRLAVLFFLTGILTSPVCFSQVSSQIIGTWTMVSMKYTFPGGEILEKNEFKYQPLKIFTKKNYSYGSLSDKGFLQGAGVVSTK